MSCLKSKRRCVVIISLLTLISIYVYVYIHIPRTLIEQQGASYYCDEKSKYAQITAFFSDDLLVDMKKLDTYRIGIEKKLREDSIAPSEEDSRLWLDAYSSNKLISVGKGENVSIVTGYGVGGSFFRFHPYNLISGCYLIEEDKIKEKVVLDEWVAWKIFGSNDVVGKMVEIEGKEFYVCGVIEHADGFLKGSALNQNGTIYLPYEAYQTLSGESNITCYELLLPNIVSGYAKDVSTKSIQDFSRYNANSIDMSMEINSVEIIENSSRFSVLNSFKHIKELLTRSIVDRKISYPHWENVARMAEDIECFILLALVILSVFLIVEIYCFIIKFRLSNICDRIGRKSRIGGDKDEVSDM